MKELLYNRFVLYAVFLIAFLDFLYLGMIRDMNSVAVFILITLLTTFFSKNMIIVLSTAVILTNVLKIRMNVMEGFEEKEEEGKEEKEEKDKKKGKKGKKGKEEVVEEEEIEQIVIDEEDEVKPLEEESSSSSVDKRDDRTKMVSAHGDLLEKMNRYKPLLDTLQGLTKNIAVVKQMTMVEKKEKKETKDSEEEDSEKELKK
jgi:hypothetical protein